MFLGFVGSVSQTIASRHDGHDGECAASRLSNKLLSCKDVSELVEYMRKGSKLNEHSRSGFAIAIQPGMGRLIS